MKCTAFLRTLFLALTCFASGAVATEGTALDEYVAKPDSSYSYAYEETRHRAGYSVHVLNMTSQQWRSFSEVDRVSWVHEVLIAVPWFFHSGNEHTAFLIVNGGSNDSSPTTENDDLLGILADVTGSVVVIVSQVPNQPLEFVDEGFPREEDALLAYGMNKYLLTGDPEWLVQLPMTKSIVRALDTVQAFSQTYPDLWPAVPRIDDAIIIGGSKRGWATWLAAAVEAQASAGSRVKAIIPVSIDLLNLDEQFTHHWEAYGFYAPAIEDYVDFDLPCRVNTPAGRAMLDLIDPYAYRDRLTMPKLVLNSAGDQFFLPDSSQFYWSGLPGPKRLRYTFNTDHSQGEDLPNVILPTLSWVSDILDAKSPPEIEWALEPEGSIRVWTHSIPKEVRLWQATNADARDFRLEAIGDAWTSTELVEVAAGEYIGYVPPPPEGWTAFAVEVTFRGSTLIPTPLESDQVFTTDVQITPDFLPYADTACPESAEPPVVGGQNPVYRFWSDRYRGQFLTISIAERDYLIENFPDVWSYEGSDWSALVLPQDGASPVYRFWSDVYQSHFFTISEAEKDYITNNYQAWWNYEGVGWYAYMFEGSGRMPIFRFWSDIYQSHFYTGNTGERDYIIQNYPEWTYEGVAWYAPTGG
ncbi:MAG: PhoPQ-activated protein PqaA family protein [Caldilineaceae bacterium]|jgi:PhoPQ-activated pathogenicity-related protein